MDSFVDFDENVDSFLSNDDGDGRDMFAALKKGSSEHNSDSLKGKCFNIRVITCSEHKKIVYKLYIQGPSGVQFATLGHYQ